MDNKNKYIYICKICNNRFSEFPTISDTNEILFQSKNYVFCNCHNRYGTYYKDPTRFNKANRLMYKVLYE